MKQVFLLISLIFAHQAFAVCSSPIARTNFSANQVLTSTRLNADLNAAYTRANELPGDCITSESITTTQIDDGTIVNADIASATISNSKLAPVNYAISSSSGVFSTSSTSNVDVTNMTASITSTGRPVEIFINSGIIQVIGNTAVSITTVTITLFRGVTEIAYFPLTLSRGTTGTGFSMTLPSSVVTYLDAAPAGTHTYKATMKVFGAGMTGSVEDSYFVVREF